jgi:Xaa-Pro aminopeptidase
MIKQRLTTLRTFLDRHQFSGYIIATTDEYLSEYAPAYAKRLEYITGFTGSNGLAVILADIVLFFTDGRYLTQCSFELDSNLFKIFDLQNLANFDWDKYVDKDEIIAYDPKLFTNRTLQIFAGIKTQAYAENLIDAIWQNQPAKPNSKIYDYPIEYAGEDSSSKIEKCRKFLKQHSAKNLIINDSSSVCWLLNIRAHDIESSPLLLANAIVTTEQVYLFIDSIDRVIKFKRDGLQIVEQKDFAKIIDDLKGMILFDVNQCSQYVNDLIAQKAHKNIKNPCSLWKACKNETEIRHMEKGHIQDAVAVCEMLAFIAKQNISDLTEYDIGQKLTEFRQKGDGYVFDSFPAICGYQDNGAVIHYRAEQSPAKKITGEGLLLIDSGGQYMGATTDITRTVSIGKPKPEHQKYYTKVLKGHIALARAIFPKDKISGAHLDVLARQYLWQDGKDYAHGTGHGVGSFLSVHEGPQSISLGGFEIAIQKGMVVSNEPGYYVPGEFGIRIENMMYAKESSKPGFLCFQDLTLVPYARELIDTNMLTEDELEHLRIYYKVIEKAVAPLLSDDAKEWLQGQVASFMKK